MRFHVILEPELTPDELVEVGLLAEQQGLAGLWLQNYSSAADPFMTLVPLARASRRIQLGVVLVSPQELHPLKLATSLLTLHEYSAGRAAVALGRGGEWLGVMQGDFRPRVKALQEALVLVRRLAHGEGRHAPVFAPGEFYRAQAFRTPWTTQSSPALVYAGVTKDRMLEMSATAADGVMLADIGLPRVVADRVRLVEKTLSETGRPRSDFIINDFVGWHVKEDPAAVAHEARRELVIRAWLEPDWLRPFLAEDEVMFVQQHKRAFVEAYRTRSGVISGVPDDLVTRLIDGLTISAPAAQLDRVLERLREFEATGLDELALRLHDDPADSIRLIGTKVLPHFR